MARPIKVVMAKLGLDIHWRGVYLVSQFLRDAGMDVVYIGNKFPEQIVEAAMQEDADVVGMSTLGGNHLSLGLKTVNLLEKAEMGGIKVFMGGVIPPKHIPQLLDGGVHKVYGPDTLMETIINGIKDSVSV